MHKTRYFSAPGRVEIGGNHTDHQHGRVLAAAINLETVAAVKPNDQNIVRWKQSEVDLTSLNPVPEERGTTAALIRGVAAWFVNNGLSIGGFDSELWSNIPIGAGLSSSAAFEVVTGNVFKGLYNENAGITPTDIARAGQFAENEYFGKPSGLMDQMASSFGGLNVIDFENPDNPVVTPVEADLIGYSICVVNAGGSHADLTLDYAGAPEEMRKVAAHFGCNYLRELSPDMFFDSIRDLRYLGDRAILRAIHFFRENSRVLKQAGALAKGNTREFLSLVNDSGNSSIAYLQNAYSPAAVQEQGVTIALALSEKVLKGQGAWRVHGGGFAGTILAFVPDELIVEYRNRMNTVFGESCCYFLSISNQGGGEGRKSGRITV